MTTILIESGKQARHQIDSQIVTVERELEALLIEVKARKKSKDDVKKFIDSVVIEFPLAAPLLCERIRAEFPEDEILSSNYLTIQIVNSYNVRMEQGDKEAEGLKTTYLSMIRRSESQVMETEQ